MQENVRITYRHVGLELPLKLISPLLAFAVACASALLNFEVVANLCWDRARSDCLFGLFAGERSTATRLGPAEALFLIASPESLRFAGESCGIILDRLLARSTRTGPIFDLRRLVLVDPEAVLLGVPGPRLPGLPRRSRPLGTCSVSIASPLLDEDSEVGDGARFMLRSPRGASRRGEHELSSSSVRLLKAGPFERVFKKPGSNRLGRERLEPVRLVLADEVEAERSRGAEMKLKLTLSSVFSSSHSLSDPIGVLRPRRDVDVDADADSSLKDGAEITLLPGLWIAITGGVVTPRPPSSRFP